MASMPLNPAAIGHRSHADPSAIAYLPRVAKQVTLSVL